MEMRKGFNEVMREMKEMREEREEQKRWLEEMKRGWEKEREILLNRIEKVEKRLEEYERGEREFRREGDKEEDGNLGGKEGELGEMEVRMRRLEIEEERRRREVRKRNLIIKGVKAKKEGIEGIREEVEKIIRATGSVAKIEEVKRLGKEDKERGDMIWVRMENVEGKIEVMKGRGKLKERREWVADDLTEKERRIDWRIKREADRWRKEGKWVRVGYMKLWVEKKLWVWDELKDRLVERYREDVGEERKRQERLVKEGREREDF